jgi:hypothetical protein
LEEREIKPQRGKMEQYLNIYLEGLRTVMKNTSQDRSNGLDLNPGLPEYEAREVSIPPMHSIIISRQVCCGVVVTTSVLFSSTERHTEAFSQNHILNHFSACQNVWPPQMQISAVLINTLGFVLITVKNARII